MLSLTAAPHRAGSIGSRVLADLAMNIVQNEVDEVWGFMFLLTGKYGSLLAHHMLTLTDDDDTQMRRRDASKSGSGVLYAIPLIDLLHAEGPLTKKAIKSYLMPGSKGWCFCVIFVKGFRFYFCCVEDFSFKNDDDFQCYTHVAGTFRFACALHEGHANTSKLALAVGKKVWLQLPIWIHCVVRGGAN